MGQPFNGDIYLADEFRKLRDKHGINYVIETGTYHGHTTQWLAENFKQVYTIESNIKHIKIAGEYWQSKPNSRVNSIGLFEADSSVYLIDVINEVPEKSPLMIFLDAHWYANPVLAELDQIKESNRKPVLVIHDFKVPGHPELGYDIYPDQGIVYEWSWIEDKIKAIYGDSYIKYYNSKATGAARGCLFIEPL